MFTREAHSTKILVTQSNITNKTKQKEQIEKE